MKVVFFGTPQFAADILQDLIDHHIDIVAVVSKPDRPKGRSLKLQPTPVKLVADNYPQIPLFQPEKASSHDFADKLAQLQPDLFVVVAYGEIIKEYILQIPKYGAINLHASLLPKYRGAAPIQRAIMAGDIETGVTVMYMVKKMDAGDMILQEKVAIAIDDTFETVSQKLCEVGKKALIDVILNLSAGKFLPQSQNHDEATFAPKIELEDCLIDWNNEAESIHNLVRGVNPFPGAWCYISLRGLSKRLKIICTKLSTGEEFTLRLAPGEVKIVENRPAAPKLFVGTATFPLEICQVQLEGKKATDSANFIKGHFDFTMLPKSC